MKEEFRLSSWSNIERKRYILESQIWGQQYETLFEPLLQKSGDLDYKHKLFFEQGYSFIRQRGKNRWSISVSSLKLSFIFVVANETKRKTLSVQSMRLSRNKAGGAQRWGSEEVLFCRGADLTAESTVSPRQTLCDGLRR